MKKSEQCLETNREPSDYLWFNDILEHLCVPEQPELRTFLTVEMKPLLGNCLPLSCGEAWRNVTKCSRGGGAVGHSSRRERRGNKYQGPGWCPVPLPLPWETGSRELKLRPAMDAHQGLCIFSKAKGRFWGARGKNEKQCLVYEGVVHVSHSGHRYLCCTLCCSLLPATHSSLNLISS